MTGQPKRLEFDADFENGSLGGAARLGVNWYHFTIRPDTWFFFHFRVRGCKDREIIFESAVRETVAYAPCPLARRMAKAPASPPDTLEDRPFVSYDGKTWARVEHAETDPRYPAAFRFMHTFTEDEAYLCHTHPYKHSDMLAWVDEVGASPLVEVGSIGASRNGVDQPLLTIGEASSRDLVVLIAREDACEPLGSWGVEGLVRFLLSDACRSVRQRYVFRIVPMVCVDGVIAGAGHSAGYGYGGSRWHEEPAPAEIQNVKNAVREWVAQGGRLKLVGKLHGGNRLWPDQGPERWQNFLAGDPGVLRMLKRHTDAYWRGHTRDSSLTIRPSGYFERFVLEEFGCPRAFGVHIQGSTPENARLCGEGLMKNIAAWLEG